MRLLASAVSVDEARRLVDLGVDIIDVKNPAEGSLGAQPPWVIRDIVETVRSSGVQISAALGDLPARPGAAALAAYGVAQLGISFIKAGLYGTRSVRDAVELLGGVRRAVELAQSRAMLVAAGYADYRTFDGLAPQEVVRAAAESGCPIVMLDTAEKNGASLIQVLSREELDSFVRAARNAGLRVALAGSIRLADVATLQQLAPDFVGVRGALCRMHDRASSLDASAARAFIRAVRATRDRAMARPVQS